MTEAMQIEDPNAVINALTARIQDLERTNEFLKNQLGAYVELPGEVDEVLKAMRKREVILLYLGGKNGDALKQDCAESEAMLMAFEQVWFLDNAPVAQEVKYAVRKAANHGICRW